MVRVTCRVRESEIWREGAENGRRSDVSSAKGCHFFCVRRWREGKQLGGDGLVTLLKRIPEDLRGTVSVYVAAVDLVGLFVDAHGGVERARKRSRGPAAADDFDNPHFLCLTTDGEQIFTKDFRAREVLVDLRELTLVGRAAGGGGCLGVFVRAGVEGPLRVTVVDADSAAGIFRSESVACSLAGFVEVLLGGFVVVEHANRDVEPIAVQALIGLSGSRENAKSIGIDGGTFLLRLRRTGKRANSD